VINLHWTCRAMLRIEDLPRISKPIVWTLHDMWPFTGGCHCDVGCTRYEAQCGNCPVLGRSGEADLSRRVWSRKHKAYAEADITLVAPSRWMAAKARKSRLFRDRNIHVIFNGLDLDIFKPVDRQQARRNLHLPEARLLLLFGAMDSIVIPGKGFDLLAAALAKLPASWQRRIDLVVFGATGPGETKLGDFKSHFLGYVYDDRRLAEIYASADAMVTPSRQDNLPCTVSESLACGTPVVAFDVGGIPEMIEHKVSGYLAEAFDTDDLARGIEYVLEQQQLNDQMHKAARKRAVENFSDREMSQKYMSLYETVTRPD
jgi:glycosyltransferase involved in cell wall biosynthesis